MLYSSDVNSLACNGLSCAPISMYQRNQMMRTVKDLHLSMSHFRDGDFKMAIAVF